LTLAFVHRAFLNRNMKKSTFLILVLANAAILAGAVYYLERIYSKAPAPVPPPSARETLAVETPAAAPAPVAPTNSTPVVILQTNQFHWREIESADYRTYIANLRGIGCPEATIKDIILTDVMKLFAERRGRFYQNGREFKFWETQDKRALTARQLEEREKQLSKIDKELPTVLRELLGVNYDRELNKYFVDSREDDRRLGFVSEDKRSQLVALRDEIEGLKEHVFDQAQNGQPVDLEGLKKIQEHRKEILAQILTPAEREEYELRTSDTAERLRAELVGFNPTEQEFREIYKLWQAHDDKYAFISADDENARRAKAQDQERIEQEIKAKIAPDRLAEYERTRSRDYQVLYTFAERYELPPGTVQSVFEIKQVAENARQTLLAERMDDAERQAGLKTIQEETQRAVRQNLGEKLFWTYARSGGSWIEALAETDPTPK